MIMFVWGLFEHVGQLGPTPASTDAARAPGREGSDGATKGGTKARRHKDSVGCPCWKDSTGFSSGQVAVRGLADLGAYCCGLVDSVMEILGRWRRPRSRFVGALARV